MTLSRRQLISASAGFSLASLVDRWSFAQAQKRQRRLIVLNTEHGLQYQHHPELIGSTAGASYQYPAFLAPVLAETNQVRIVTGLFNTEMNDQHGSFEASLCCVTPPPCGSDSCVHSLGGISIDQVIANALDAASPTKLKSIHLTTPYRLSDQFGRTYSASGPGRNLPPEASAELSYARVFGSATQVSTGKTPVSDTARRTSILDLVGADAQRIRRIAPSGAKPQIEQFMASLESHQNRLKQLNGAPAASSAACKTLPTPSLKLPYPEFKNDRDGAMGMRGSWKYADYAAYNNAQLDLIAMALACNLTSTAYMDIGSNIYPDISINQDHHDFTHGNKYFGPDESNRDFGMIAGPSNVEGKDGIIAIDNRHAQFVARLVASLKSFTNGDGTTLLDDTLILWNANAGCSHHFGFNEIPVVLIGGKNVGPAFTFVRFGDTGGKTAANWDNPERPLPKSRFLGDLYTSMANWFGVPLSTFGNPEFAQGPLPL